MFKEILSFVLLFIENIIIFPIKGSYNVIYYIIYGSNNVFVIAFSWLYFK